MVLAQKYYYHYYAPIFPIFVLIFIDAFDRFIRKYLYDYLKFLLLLLLT